MKKKTAKAVQFIDGLHEFIVGSPQYRKRTKGKTEVQIQTEIRPLILRYLENHFTEQGFRDAERKAIQSFYWEGQEGSYGGGRNPTFGARNYPDFIILSPYRVAVEYKQSRSGSLVKQLIGQSVVHTMSGDFDYVCCLFHDQNNDGRIRKSRTQEAESRIIETIWREFNVRLVFA